MDRPIELVLRAGDVELPIGVGDVLPARVLGPATVWVAGVRLRAVVPPGMEVGAAVRVRVTEVGPARVVLSVLHDAPEGGTSIDVRA